MLYVDSVLAAWRDLPREERMVWARRAMKAASKYRAAVEKVKKKAKKKALYIARAEAKARKKARRRARKLAERIQVGVSNFLPEESNNRIIVSGIDGPSRTVADNVVCLLRQSVNEGIM